MRVRCTDFRFGEMLRERYQGFVEPRGKPDCMLEVELGDPLPGDADAEVRVYREGAVWRMVRGDFSASWDPLLRVGRVRQAASPYAIDTVLRLIHTLLLAPEGGFLLHAASATCGGRAVIFPGVSGAGKTTMSRLAPADVRVLTDEISYIRRVGEDYVAYGTPFAGELARNGENVRAPIDTVYLLAQGPENRVDTLSGMAAAREILACVLFFAEDARLAQKVFSAAVTFAERVRVRRLTFRPERAAWDCIRPRRVPDEVAA